MSEGGPGSARRVEPRVPKGFQDFLPGDAALRQHLISTVRKVYDAHGFVPLFTPSVEHRETLLGPGGVDADGSIFRVSCDEDDALGLRFDLTVPLARVVAAHQQDLPRPFRRYQVGTVWRVDKPGPGRFREFMQFDADIVGTTSAVADAEVVSALRDAFEGLVPARGGPPRFLVRVSDRRLLDALVHFAGLDPARAPDLLRVVDKLDRIGRDKIRLELTEGYVDESGDRVPGVGFDPRHVAAVLRFLEIPRNGRSAVLAALRSFFGGDARGVEAIEAMKEMGDLLTAFGVSEEEAVFDVAIARGLSYYTGPVFEVALLEAPSFGSVGSGGRYDDLVGRFSGQPWPGVGVSCGIDRLLAALKHVGVGQDRPPSADVLVTIMDPARMNDYGAMVRELRAAGLRAEIFTGTGSGFGRQVKYADKAGIGVVVIAGADEFARGSVTVKQMKEPAFDSEASRENWLAARLGQREVPRERLVEAVNEARASAASARK